jgi:hypothetical protein
MHLTFQQREGVCYRHKEALMQIRNVVQHTGVPAKTIRYYEQIGLLPPRRA